MITITIRTENDTFSAAPHTEVARILREIAATFERGYRPAVMDSNGNRVGEVKLTGKDREL